MTRARLTFPQGDPIEFALDDVAAFGPEITASERGSARCTRPRKGGG